MVSSNSRGLAVRASVAIALLVSCLLLAGCPTYTRPAAPPRQLTQEQKNFEAAFLASQDVLIDYGFEIDRRDRRRGEVTTKPMLARHLFELWRRDATTGFDIAEGALHKIYIVASVKIERMSASSDQFIAVVSAERLRSSTPEEQFDSVRFIQRAPPRGSAAGPTVSGSGANFVNLGRDENLEMQIANEISSAAVSRLARMNYAP